MTDILVWTIFNAFLVAGLVLLDRTTGAGVIALTTAAGTILLWWWERGAA